MLVAIEITGYPHYSIQRKHIEQQLKEQHVTSYVKSRKKTGIMVKFDS